MKTLTVAERLRHNILFEELDDVTFGSLWEHLRERRYAPGQIILEDESEGEELFLLVEGRVKILKKTRTGEEKLLAFLHPGDFFGELELVDGRPRSARVMAVDPCFVYVLSKGDFEWLLLHSHPFTIRMLQVLSLRLRALNNHFISELERSAQRSASELQKLERLIEATKTVNSTLDLDRLLDVILETALGIVNGERGTLYLLDEARQILWSKVLTGGTEPIRIELPLGKGIAGYVAATGDVLNIPDAYMDPRFNPDFDKRTGFRTKTILCMPLRTKDDRIIGVFQLLNKREGIFTHDDEGFIESLSIHAAIAIENARLYEQERQKLMMEKELFAAREVQMSLIPKELPLLGGFQFAAYTLPAQEVGGDLYDFIRLDNERWVAVVADVSGKGLPAALLATLTKGIFFSQASRGGSLANYHAESNRIIRSNFPRKSFITALLARVEAGLGTVAVASAGHCYPVVYRRLSQTAEVLRLRGLALNFSDDPQCVETTIKLESGDSIVLYTDGVSEASNADGEFFGTERLADVVAKSGLLDAGGLKDKILQELEKFTAGAPQHDDITLMVIRAAR